MKNDMNMLGQLIGRNLKIFLKDRAGVFFALLAPLIALMLYVFFLGDVQLETVKSAMAGIDIEEKYLRSFIDGWLFAGLMGVSCVTVAFSANSVMVQDRARGTLADILVSPVKERVLHLSYLLYNILVTLTICGIVLAVVFVYLAIAGWYLTAASVFAILGNTILSVLSSSVLCVFVASFIRSEAAMGGLIGIISAAVGFLVGAYFPLTMLPKGVQYVVLFLPGTYSTAIYRSLFMGGALDRIGESAPMAVQPLREDFSLELNCFGHTLNPWQMCAVLAASIVLFALLFGIVRAVLRNKNPHAAFRAKKGKRDGQ